MIQVTDQPNGKLVVLIAEDDEDDYFILADILKGCGEKPDVRWVDNGEDLLCYLLKEGKYQDPEESPTPRLIFVDIRMPKRDGLTATKMIRENENIKKIPIIIVSTSNSEKEVSLAYQNGANSYIRKPMGVGETEEFQKLICTYWSSLLLFP